MCSSDLPLKGRTAYTVAENVRHCREDAPEPEGLVRIIGWLRARNAGEIADLLAFMASSGLRIGEALALKWDAVRLDEGLVRVKREKRGVNPWVAITPEIETLLRDMQTRRQGDWLFPSPIDMTKPRSSRAIGRQIQKARKEIGRAHV